MITADKLVLSQVQDSICHISVGDQWLEASQLSDEKVLRVMKRANTHPSDIINSHQLFSGLC